MKVAIRPFAEQLRIVARAGEFPAAIDQFTESI